MATSKRKTVTSEERKAAALKRKQEAAQNKALVESRIDHFKKIDEEHTYIGKSYLQNPIDVSYELQEDTIHLIVNSSFFSLNKGDLLQISCLNTPAKENLCMFDVKGQLTLAFVTNAEEHKYFNIQSSAGKADAEFTEGEDITYLGTVVHILPARK